MKLADALQRTGITQWRRIAREYGLSHLEYSSDKLYQQLLKELRNEEQQKRILREMLPEDRRFLYALLLTHQQGQILDLPSWKKYFSFLDPKRQNISLNLEKYGLLFPGEQLALPQELAELHLKIFLEDEKPESLRTDSLIYTDNNFVAIRDLISILAEIGAKEVRVTQQGEIYKQDCSVLLSRLTGSTGNFSGTALDFLLRFAIHRGLISNDGSRIMLTERIEAYFTQSMQEIWTQLLMFLQRQYADNPVERLAWTVLVTQMQLSEEKTLLSSEDWCRRFVDYGGVLSRNRPREWQEMTALIYYLGIVRKAEKGEKEYFSVNPEFHRLFSGEDYQLAQDFFIHDDFSCSYTAYLRPDLQWQLCSFTDSYEEGRIIARASIYRSLLKGKKAKEILQFLESYAATGLPSHLVIALQDWQQAFGQVFVLDTCLLCCKDEEIAGRIENNPLIRPFLREKLSEGVFLILQADAGSLLKALEEGDFWPYLEKRSPENMPFRLLGSVTIKTN